MKKHIHKINVGESDCASEASASAHLQEKCIFSKIVTTLPGSPYDHSAGCVVTTDGNFEPKATVSPLHRDSRTCRQPDHTAKAVFTKMAERRRVSLASCDATLSVGARMCWMSRTVKSSEASNEMVKGALLLSLGLVIMGASTVGVVWFVANHPEHNYGDPLPSAFAIPGAVGALLGAVGLFRLLTAINGKLRAFIGRN